MAEVIKTMKTSEDAYLKLPLKVARVLVLEEPRNGLDLSKAKLHGELTTIFGPGVKRPSIFKPTEYSATLLRRLGEMQFDPTSDHILLAGSMASVAIAMGAIMMHWQSVKILMFSAVEGVYTSRTLDALEVNSLVSW